LDSAFGKHIDKDKNNKYDNNEGNDSSSPDQSERHWERIGAGTLTFDRGGQQLSTNGTSFSNQ
jgi:hypothetical protein